MDTWTALVIKKTVLELATNEFLSTFEINLIKKI